MQMHITRFSSTWGSSFISIHMEKAK